MACMGKPALYSRLYAHVSTVGRSQLENFLTEALVDLLERARPERAIGFVTGVLLKDAHVRLANRVAAVETILRSAKRIEWNTRSAIRIDGTVKYPDILLYADGTPTLLVENKISSGYTKREIPIGEKGLETEIREQFEDYGRWLSKKNRALVLLTSGTRPPQDYLREDAKADKKYGLSLRSVCNWRQVCDWLVAKGTDLESELGEFLVEKGLDDMNKADLEALNGFLARPRLHKKLDEAINAAKTSIEKLLLHGKYSTTLSRPSSEFGDDAVYGWFNPFKNRPDRVYWGFSPGHSSHFPDLGLSKELYGFVAIEAPHLRIRHGRFPKWHRCNQPLEYDWWVLHKKAISFIDEGGLTASFERWIGPLVGEGLDILKLARRQPQL
jgi:hypothetical protein